jgi:flagellar motility protein MotE (MotC chaperone)
MPSKPGEVKGPKAPGMPATKAPDKPAAKAPDKPAAKAPVMPGAKTVPSGKAAAAEEHALSVEEPEEEVFGDARSKGHRKAGRKLPAGDRPEITERKTTWSADRYAAVVPPGLTLAALRSQMGKGQTAPEPASTTTDPGSGATLADLEKARESLRQETARLEALLKATGNCGGSVGMPIGDGMGTPTVVSPAALREAPVEQIDSVSKAMKGMKPEQAAALVARLDRALAAEILRRMKPSDAGAILGMVKPELAAELATQIATRKSSAKDKKGSPK